MESALAAYGAMAASAFLAATILPFPSEATFAGLIYARTVDPLALFAVATAFNTAGSCVNWWVGKVAAERGVERLPARFRPEPAAMAKAEGLFRRFGWPSLAFSWVPGVGDLATLAAGLLHYPFWRFALLVGVGKAARYAAIWAGLAAVAG